jgi:hypothetical protein
MLEVSFTGNVRRSDLDKLRSALGLTARGRLTDDWDAEFGERVLSPRDSDGILLTLWRDLDRDGWWDIVLTYENNPLPDAEVDEWEREITSVIASLGFTVQKLRSQTRNRRPGM